LKRRWRFIFGFRRGIFTKTTEYKVVQFKMKGKIRRKVRVHKVIAMIRCQCVLVEAKRVREAMCPRLMTGEVRQLVI
jgi:hypothetical protein